MKDNNQPYSQLDRLRSYSSIFTRSFFLSLQNQGDLSFINIKIKRYDNERIGKDFVTYLDYIKYIYNRLRKEYRCEYLYKNTLINNLLLKKYGTENTTLINEFRVGNSVADMALFNGTSKAFEIKTELDSDKRLEGQLSDYSKIFNESYIVTHESLLKKYISQNDSIGIITISSKGKTLKVNEVRKAKLNYEINPNVLIRTIRTQEYKNIVNSYYGILPEMNSFNMFNICSSMMKEIPHKELHQLFINEIKKRKTNNSILNKCQSELSQICLSLNFNEKSYQNVFNKLNRKINL